MFCHPSSLFCVSTRNAMHVISRHGAVRADRANVLGGWLAHASGRVWPRFIWHHCPSVPAPPANTGHPSLTSFMLAHPSHSSSMIHDSVGPLRDRAQSDAGQWSTVAGHMPSHAPLPPLEPVVASPGTAPPPAPLRTAGTCSSCDGSVGVEGVLRVVSRCTHSSTAWL